MDNNAYINTVFIIQSLNISIASVMLHLNINGLCITVVPLSQGVNLGSPLMLFEWRWDRSAEAWGERGLGSGRVANQGEAWRRHSAVVVTQHAADVIALVGPHHSIKLRKKYLFGKNDNSNRNHNHNIYNTVNLKNNHITNNNIIMLFIVIIVYFY